ncbi:alpha/beta fold hydrolase [Actinomadura kijaniata]|uniref:alpha/beta fold hydrolase n=1 Tax=Actinomadura kijaniata TaxID=46161 RepID=UPI003F198A9E
MPRIPLRPVRFAGRLILMTAAAAGLAGLFLVLIVLTGGAGSGLAAWLATLGCGTLAALWRGRRRPWPGRLRPLLPVVLAAALTASVCVPTAPVRRRYPPALPFVATQHWNLATGSRVAVYHYPPAPGTARRSTPLVYLHGGPVRGISVLDHRFLQLLARQGHDVYAYEHAGGGRSGLLPMGQYTVSRSVRDLTAFVDHLGKERVDVLGFSAGAVVLAQALAVPRAAGHVRRAIIAEPGPMDGPTTRISGHRGRPSARGLAPAMTGPRSTRVPRYAVALGLMRLGLLEPDTGLVGQAETVNAFRAADLGGDTASAYCARDAHRIPTEDTPQNFSFNPAASLHIQQKLKDSPSIAPRLRRSRTPAMLMIAECSSQVRQWATAILANAPAVQRTQYMPGVGHRMWNGLDGNNERAAAVITAFLQNGPPPLRNYPTRADIPTFLHDRR